MRRHRIEGQVVVVTGGARGIGLAIAEALVTAGARVAIGDLDLDLAEAAAAQLGGGCVALPLDVTDPMSFEAFLDAAEHRLGRLDVLVNNAGIMLVGDFVDLAGETDDLQLEINLRGVLIGMRLAGQRMRARGAGQIVNIASMAGLVGAPGGVVYSATKHAVVGAAAALRAELRPQGVHVATVCPSIVRTELARGLGGLVVPPVEPSDVAAAVLRVIAIRRHLVTVPRWLIGIVAVTGWLPISAREAIARAMGSDRALADADPRQRAAYEARARRSAAGGARRTG